MKFNGFGCAKVLSSSEIDKLFAWGFTNSKDRALFGICLHTGCKISEALATTTLDLKMVYITLKKRVTKSKKRTRMIPITDPLQGLIDTFLKEYQPKSFLFTLYYSRCVGDPTNFVLNSLTLVPQTLNQPHL